MLVEQEQGKICNEKELLQKSTNDIVKNTRPKSVKSGKLTDVVLTTVEVDLVKLAMNVDLKFH